MVLYLCDSMGFINQEVLKGKQRILRFLNRHFMATSIEEDAMKEKRFLIKKIMTTLF